MTISRADRPLSPHLQVYKPQITSMLSILHRATGVFLSIGTLMLVAWLYAAAYDAAYLDAMNSWFTHWAGMLVLAAWTGAFYYHLGNGLRHLLWDTGRGFDLKNVMRSGIAVLLFASAATAGTWYFILAEKGVI